MRDMLTFSGLLASVIGGGIMGAKAGKHIMSCAQSKVISNRHIGQLSDVSSYQPG